MHVLYSTSASSSSPPPLYRKFLSVLQYMRDGMEKLTTASRYI